MILPINRQKMQSRYEHQAAPQERRNGSRPEWWSSLSPRKRDFYVWLQRCKSLEEELAFEYAGAVDECSDIARRLLGQDVDFYAIYEEPEFARCAELLYGNEEYKAFFGELASFWAALEAYGEFLSAPQNVVPAADQAPVILIEWWSQLPPVKKAFFEWLIDGVWSDSASAAYSHVSAVEQCGILASGKLHMDVDFYTMCSTSEVHRFGLQLFGKDAWEKPLLQSGPASLAASLSIYSDFVAEYREINQLV